MIRDRSNLETWVRLLNWSLKKKVIFTLGVSLLSGLIIYFTTYYFDNLILFTLFTLPVTLTSFLYANKFNVIPAFIVTLIYIPAFIDYAGGLYIINLILTIPILYIISISIGYAGHEILKWTEAENRKDILNTILHQDLRSNNQVVLGYLQLIEDDDLSEKNKNYFKKALNGARKGNEILELAKMFRKIEDEVPLEKRDLDRTIDKVFNEISKSDKNDGVKLERKYDGNICKIRGTNTLEHLFSEILKTRMKDRECEKIEIDAFESDEKILVRIEDDGEKIHKEIKNLLSDDDYSGFTTGDGGFRYYMIRQMAEYNEADIDVKNTASGGARFDIRLDKAI